MSTPWVVVRSWNDASIIERTLQGIRDQDLECRILVLDNESNDGTAEIARRYAERLVNVPKGTYIPGRVLNRGMALTDGELVVFVNSDCPPVDRRWLRELLDSFQPETAASFSCQVPRPDCYPVFARDTENTFGSGELQKRWRHCFSMASSAVRRSVWKKMPFSETIAYSEDIEWTWRARRRGHQIVYAPRSIVEHSHNYTLQQFHRRQRGEGLADAQIFEWDDWSGSWLRYSVLPAIRQTVSDWKYCLRSQQWSWLLWAPLYRISQMLGRRRGFLEGLTQLDQPPEETRCQPGHLPTEEDICFATVGSSAFNQTLAQNLKRIGEAVNRALEGQLEALILGGGYGRGEGGVIEVEGAERAYNDLDFTLLVKSSSAPVHNLARVSHQFEREMGVDVDFSRPLTVTDIRRWPHWLMWYDLLHGHVVVEGEAGILVDHAPGRVWRHPPTIEASRLLLNRGAGLLWAHLVAGGVEAAPDPHFVVRNYHKAALAMGDAVLLARRVYKTAYWERKELLIACCREEPHLETLAPPEAYAEALDFRLRPDRHSSSVGRAALDQRRSSFLKTFLWLESVRTGQAFTEAVAYRRAAFLREPAQSAPTRWPRNLVRTLQLGRPGWRYPREDLFRELPVLLEAPRPGPVQDFLKVWRRFN